MITDNLKNLKNYSALNKRFEAAFNFILNTDLKNIPCARYQIDGDDIYANVEEYTTKTRSKVEYHKKYIDIQLVALGCENIGYCNIDERKNSEEFDEDKDIGFAEGNVSLIKMIQGNFMILFPQDAHQPCMAIDGPSKVKKIVVKVKVD